MVPEPVAQSLTLLPQKEVGLGLSVLYLFDKARDKAVPKARPLEPLE